jgi:septum site-determining protein MinC
MLMPLFGKSPTGQPRRPFDLSQQSGEQVDAVRSKIASLMDGVTERGAAAAAEQPTDPAPAYDAPPAAAPRPVAPSADEQQWSPPLFADESTTEDAPTDWSTAEWPRSPKPATNDARQEPWPRRTSNSSESAPTNQPADAPQARSTWPLPPVQPPVAEQPLSRPQEATPQDALPPSAINIKGRAGGILIEIGNGSWPLLMTTLAERLTGAGNFFRNGAVALDLGPRRLAAAELDQIHKLLTDQTLELVLVRTAAQDTFDAAVELGFSAQLETLDGAPTVSAQPALSNLARNPHFVYAGHLRAGQVLKRHEHILVIGDVNPGASVISDGDILVWGHLRGMVHAGAGGDAKAMISALNLAPVQLRINDVIAIAPDPEPKRKWRRQQSPLKLPEVAYLNGDRIMVEPWDATRFGGIAALRQAK